VTATEFFRSQISEIGTGESEEILAALSGRTPKLDSVPEICGHRLAYLETLGRQINGCAEIVEDIREMWKTRGSRIEAIHLLGATQGLLVGALTAAYGGRSHLSRPLYNDMIRVFGRPIGAEPLDTGHDFLSTVKPSDSAQYLLKKVGARADLLNEAQFLIDVANKLDDLGIHFAGRNVSTPISSERHNDVFPLDKAQFEHFMRTFERERVKRGEWGRWADQVTDYLRQKGKRPDIEEYRDVLEEIETNLKPLPFFPRMLEAISRVFWMGSEIQKVGPPTSESMGLQIVLEQSGRAARLLATRLKGRVYVNLWGCSVPRPLCENWVKIRAEESKRLQKAYS
jgi:hypothetical protein